MKIKSNLFLGVLAGMLFSPLVQAATYNVGPVESLGGGLGDVPHVPGRDGSCKLKNSDTKCTLRAAIQAANANPDRDNTILIDSGTYVLTLAGVVEDAAATGDLDIKNQLLRLVGDQPQPEKSLTIRPASVGEVVITATTGDAAAIDRIFHIFPNTRVTLSGLTIRGGNPGGDSFGGGILNGGKLTLQNGSVIFNQASSGGGVYNQRGATFNSLGSTLANNQAVWAGGALYNVGTANIVTSFLNSNSALSDGHESYGGAINNSSVLNIYFSTFSQNQAANGGALYSDEDNAPPSPSTKLNYVTLVNNTAVGAGGGIYSGKDIEVSSYASIIAGNTAAVGPDCTTAITSMGYNIIGNTDLCNIKSKIGDHMGTKDSPIDPLVDVHSAFLAGGVMAYPLLNGSLAIDQVPATSAGERKVCDDMDHRIVLRDAVGACDVGAYEGACGNKFVDTHADAALNEECDDGNVADGDGCSSTCKLEGGGQPQPPAVPAGCGNTVVDAGEGCDDGNIVDGDGCSSGCVVEVLPAVCGNGVLEAPELCDDGNQDDTDACLNNCTVNPDPNPTPTGGGGGGCSLSKVKISYEKNNVLGFGFILFSFVFIGLRRKWVRERR